MHDRLRPSALKRLLGETMAGDPDLPKPPCKAARDAVAKLRAEAKPGDWFALVKKRRMTPAEFAAVKQRLGK